MSIGEIILALLNLLFGTGFIVTLVTLKESRKKAITGVEKDSVELVSTTVTTMIDSVNRLMDQNKKLQEELELRRNEGNSLSDRINQLDKKISCILRTNREVIKVLEKLGIDEHIINMLKEEGK